MINYIEYKSPIGTLYIIADEQGVLEITLQKPCDSIISSTTLHAQNCVNALHEYFNCVRTDFLDITISPNIKGSDFQKRVWHELCNIPYASTASYANIAQAIDSPKACRAVGNANHNNPIPIIVPCHRVIGSNGALTGYGLGLDSKKYLLDLEQRNSTLTK